MHEGPHPFSPATPTVVPVLEGDLVIVAVCVVIVGIQWTVCACVHSEVLFLSVPLWSLVSLSYIHTGLGL